MAILSPERDEIKDKKDKYGVFESLRENINDAFKDVFGSQNLNGKGLVL